MKTARRKEKGWMIDLSDVKRQVFFGLLEQADRVFVLVRHSDAVSIGNRGFKEAEKEDGMVLVFNKGMHFTWDSTGIHATLAFGGTQEKCFVPPGDIVAIYSPELGAQLTCSPVDSNDAPSSSRKQDADGKVIQVDFTPKDVS